jgi:hypothetical protein
MTCSFKKTVRFLSDSGCPGKKRQGQSPSGGPEAHPHYLDIVILPFKETVCSFVQILGELARGGKDIFSLED